MKKNDTINPPKGWEIKKLGEVCKVIAGQSPEGKYYNSEGIGMPFYQGKKEFCEKFIGEPTTWTTKITKEAEANDILMSVRAPVGPINFATQKICIGRGLAAIRAGEEVDVNFLFGFLLKHENEIIGNAGAVFDSISKTQIENITIPFPPLPEQHRIVSLLDKCFSAIDQAKAHTEQNLKNAKELFDCALDRILDDKKWKVKRLGEVCEKVEYGTSSKAKSQGVLPVLRMGNIQKGKIIWNSLVYSDNKEDNSQYLLKYNDVLFNRTNSLELVGKTAIFKGERPAIFAGYLIRIHRKENMLDADYLNYYLNSKKAFEYGKSVVISSVNQANINGTKLKTYPIPLPPLYDQQTIVRQLDTLRAETQKLEAVYQKKMANLEELKKSVLQRAFNCQDLDF